MKRCALVVLVACGGGTDTGPITAAQARTPCTTTCNHQITCGSSVALDACISACVDNVAGWTRRDVMDDQAACTAALTCDQSDTVCLADITPLPIHHTWATKCRDQLPNCTTPAQLELVCTVDYDPTNIGLGLLRFAAPVVINELLACLDGVGCSEFTCVNTVLDKYKITLLR